MVNNSLWFQYKYFWRCFQISLFICIDLALCPHQIIYNFQTCVKVDTKVLIASELWIRFARITRANIHIHTHYNHGTFLLFLNKKMYFFKHNLKGQNWKDIYIWYDFCVGALPIPFCKFFSEMCLAPISFLSMGGILFCPSNDFDLRSIFSYHITDTGNWVIKVENVENVCFDFQMGKNRPISLIWAKWQNMDDWDAVRLSSSRKW